MSQISIYKKFLKQRHIQSYRFLNVAWAVVGSIIFYLFAIFEPWSASLFDYLIENGVSELVVYTTAMPLIMIMKAWLLVESIGYFYHRFVEHLGLLTRLSNQVRKNQANHWKHHMIDYPIGSYQRSHKWIPWEWAFPGFLTSVLLFVFKGITLSSVVFFIFMVLYVLIFAKTYARFHIEKNSWADSKYFHWLEDIHVLHHWDQATNYTITSPLFDIIFGTYISPKKHSEILKEAKKNHKLYTSDLINWNYMVHFAWPKKLALQVSDIKRSKDQEVRFRLVLADLKREFKKNPDDVLLNIYLNRMETFDSSI